MVPFDEASQSQTAKSGYAEGEHETANTEKNKASGLEAEAFGATTHAIDRRCSYCRRLE